jgi:CxxC motif-containing protein
MLTTTVKVRGGLWPLLPVHTAEPIPKSAIFPLLSELRQIEVKAPLQCGQVILRDAVNTGVDVLASRDLPARDASSAEACREPHTDG